MRRSRIAGLILLFLVGIFAIRPAAAQQSNPPRRQDSPREWGVWGAFSFHTLGLGGLSDSDIEGRKLVLAGVRYGYVLTHGKSLSISYTLDMIPVAIAFHSQTQPASSSSTAYSRQNVYGFGASPIGFQFNFLTNHTVQPYIGLTGGFLYFQEPVPSPIGTHWNFTATGSTGFQFFVSDRRAITLAYMFHHISNAREQQENPSLNTDMIYLGFSFFMASHARD